MLKTTEKALIAAGFKVYGSTLMVNGELFPLPLVEGNSKLGTTVWHASTLPTNRVVTAVIKDKKTKAVIKSASGRGTCPLTCCDDNGNTTCYGTKGHYTHDSIKYLLIKRTEFLRKYPEQYFKAAEIQLQHERVEKLRIHATGDFIPGEAARWADVLRRHLNERRIESAGGAA